MPRASVSSSASGSMAPSYRPAPRSAGPCLASAEAAAPDGESEPRGSAGGRGWPSRCPASRSPPGSRTRRRRTSGRQGRRGRDGRDRMADRVPASGRAAVAASRTSAGSTPNTSRIRSSVRTSDGGPSATSRPRSMTTRRGKKWAARPRSWRTATIAVPSRSLRSRSSSIASTWWRRSRWTVGSSSSMTGAACATARASSTSWRSPSESSRASRPMRCPTPTRSIAAATAARSAGRGPRSGASCGSRPSATTSSTRIANGSATCCGTTASRRATCGPLQLGDRRPAELDPPGRRPQRPREHAQERRLAGAVRAHEGDPLAIGDRERDVAQDRPPAGLDRHAVGMQEPSTGSQLVPRPGPDAEDEEERRADDRGDHARPAPRRASARRGRRRRGSSPRTASRSAAPGGRSGRRAGARRAARRARRTRSGPAIATPAAVTSDASPSRITRSRRTSTPRCAAASSPSRNPLRARERARISALPPRISGAATASRDPGGAVEAAEQVREDLAQARARDVHRHRQAGGEQRAHGVAREQQRGQRREGARPRQPVDDGHRQQRPDERQPVEQAELRARGRGPGSGRRWPPRARRRTPCRARTGRRAGCGAGPGTWRPRRPARRRRASPSGRAAAAGRRRSPRPTAARSPERRSRCGGAGCRASSTAPGPPSRARSRRRRRRRSRRPRR